MAGPFCNPYCVDANEYENHLRLPWAGPNGNPPWVTVDVALIPRKRPMTVKMLPMFFDTGATRSHLRKDTAESLGLDLTWGRIDGELQCQELPDGRRYLCLARRLSVRIEGRFYQLNAHVPMVYETVAKTLQMRSEAIEELLQRGQLRSPLKPSEIVDKLGMNILGLGDTLEHFVACVAREGLFLFPRRTVRMKHTMLGALLRWLRGSS